MTRLERVEAIRNGMRNISKCTGLTVVEPPRSTGKWIETCLAIYGETTIVEGIELKTDTGWIVSIISMSMSEHQVNDKPSVNNLDSFDLHTINQLLQ